MNDLFGNVHFGNFLNAGADQYKVLGWIVLLPLIGAIINGIFGRRIGRQGVYIVGVATVGFSFLLSLLAFAALVRATHAAGAELGEGEEHPAVRLTYLAWEWFKAPTVSGDGAPLYFRYVLDALSGVMLLVVTGVGTLIHLYSTGYMSHDEGYARFFAYLNLFMFSMLNLILGDSIVLLFVGWEGVGLCSYLLIGFWFQNPQYASAGRKAFVVNRIGDVGVILGISILAFKLGVYDFSSMRELVADPNSAGMHDLASMPGMDNFLASQLSRGVPGLFNFFMKVIPSFTWGGAACFFLFIGCTGKSAQLPLYVWLPDAMAGPTPVSALIHAATMVTAGVYLLCRTSFLFVHFPTVMAIIAVIGACTALFAATIALAQNELKKVLAYSTVSQLGYMFLGCGVGAFGAGLFHVYTHAMFKACMFLGAGAVMHACRDKQDLRELGGLRKYIPYTYWTFAIATAAIIGTPGLSGFFSKDEILYRALASHNANHPWVGKFTFAVGVLTAALTAFYMCRLFFLTFWGEFKGWSLDPNDAKYAAAPAMHGIDKAGAAIEIPAHSESEPEHANVAAAEHEVGHGHAAHDDHDDHGHDDHGHDDHGHGHGAGNPWDPPHENPWNMTVPLMVLAFMSVVAGYIGLPKLFTGHESPLERWLEPVITEWRLDENTPASLGWTGLAMGTGAFLVGTAAAYFVYVMQGGAPAKSLAGSVPGLYRLVHDKWRIDELYDVLIVRPLRWLSDLAAAVFDRWIIDGIVRLFGAVPRLFGAGLKKVQTGRIQTYGAVFAVGMLALLGWAVMSPGASITYRITNPNAASPELALKVYGGPGYSYWWDLDGDGQYPQDPTSDTEQTTSCEPHEAPDGRQVCVVGVRVRNAFGFTHDVKRTIEIRSAQQAVMLQGAR